MKLIGKLIVMILANAAAIWAAGRLVPGFNFHGGMWDLLAAGLVLGIVNSFVRPILKLVTLPVILLTLGLFTVIVNIACLLFVAWLLPTLSIAGFWAALWGTVVIGLVNYVILSVIKE
ncbi:MAG: phage holin family protein [Candidatus Pacebacteria bacterium]|nr:phage holin family protein [Candidatus Paceibacterota bacterium]